MPTQSRAPVRSIEHQGRTLAVVVSAQASFPGGDGIAFYGAPEDAMQLGHMARPAGHVVAAHRHEPVDRTVGRTQEVLFLRRGRVRLEVLTEEGEAVESVEMGPGDVVLLLEGGHGLTVLEDADIVEAKNGPYVGQADKHRF